MTARHTVPQGSAFRPHLPLFLFAGFALECLPLF